MHFPDPFEEPVTRLEEDKKYAHALRRVYLGKLALMIMISKDHKKLTDGALAVCRDLHINIDDMFDKNLEDFERELGKKVPKEIV